MIIVIGRDGNSRMIVGEGAEPYLALGQPEQRRASHVEPCDHALRVVFRLLRRIFGDTGQISDWTRGWGVDWRADMGPMGGPVLEVFNDRTSALAAERAWLVENYLDRQK